MAALGGFLFGYDTAVISGTIAQVTQLFQLDALQQGWYVGCALVGSIVGVLFAGILSDKLGRKLTMVISAVLFSTSALGCALSADFAQLVVYRIIGGVGIGVVSIVSPLYISELAVAQYRGRLVSLYQLAVTVGFLGAYLVNQRGLSGIKNMIMKNKSAGNVSIPNIPLHTSVINILFNQSTLNCVPLSAHANN